MVISERTSVPPRYRLIEEVGQGGMAIVYRAQDEALQREVAIKILHPHLSADLESRARLAREAQAVAKLKHPNILEIFDYSGAAGDAAFIVTELIHGQTLKQFAKTRPTGQFPEIAVLLAAELGGALAHAHGFGVIHRDIKPENVMIRSDGLVKLMDFGIAQVVDLERMTVTGQLLGSPAYMAPELIDGRPLDVRTDVFGLGILLYELATGILPFAGKNPHEVLKKISEGRFADARIANRCIGENLWKIMSRALAHEPADRYPSMAELTAELRHYLTECGLGETTDQLRTYFADPASYEKHLPSRMTTALMATAERYLAERSIPRAIQCWNRILSYDSANERVMAALQRMERRSRVRMYGSFALAGAGLAVLIALLSRLLASGPVDEPRARSLPPATTRVERPADPVSSGALAANGLRRGAKPGDAPGGESESLRRMERGPASSPSRSRLQGGAASALNSRDVRGRRSEASSEASSERRHAPGTGAAASPTAEGVPTTGDDSPTVSTADAPAASPMPRPGGAAESRTFMLGPTPQNVDVFLDGQRQFAYDTDHRSLTVSWDRDHVVEFRSPAGCCFVERIPVGPRSPLPSDGIIARRLKWKPARLLVTLAPRETKARIMVRDASGTGRGAVIESGEEANIPFSALDEGQKDVEISVDAEGGPTRERVTVRAGESKSVVVNVQARP